MGLSFADTATFAMNDIQQKLGFISYHHSNFYMWLIQRKKNNKLRGLKSASEL
jgi:hypothetical protein